MYTMSNLSDFWGEASEAFSHLHFGWQALFGSAIIYYGLSSVLSVIKFFARQMKSVRSKTDFSGYNPSTIYLHVFPRSTAPGTPNLSPFGVKVEAWFRLKNIKFELVETLEFSSTTNQIPYIVHNGEEVSDSEQIIEYVIELLGLDPTEGLTEEQQGAVTAFTAMMDELHVWTYIIQRYAFKFELYKKHYLRLPIMQPLKYIIESFFPKSVIEKLTFLGIGKKTEAEINQIAFKTLRAVSLYLGKKPYLMGDVITKIDCVIFGHLSQIMFIDFPYPHRQYIEENCQNLQPYVRRIKEILYPDWCDIVVKVKK